jgi:hypothetical protein
MTTNTLTVLLDGQYDDEQITWLMRAIGMLRMVESVTPVEPEQAARYRFQRALEDELRAAIGRAFDKVDPYRGHRTAAVLD